MNKQDIQTVLDALGMAVDCIDDQYQRNTYTRIIAAIAILQAALAEPEPFTPDWVSYRQGVADGKEALAEPSEPVSDLVERLQLGDGSSPDHALLLEAANAIEHLIGELRKGLKQEEILENKLFKEIHKSTPDPVAYLVLFEGAGKLLEFTKGNYLHGAKVEHIPLFTHPASKPEKLTDEEILLAISPFYKDTLTRRAAIEVSIDEYRAIEQAVISRIKP